MNEAVLAFLMGEVDRSVATAEDPISAATAAAAASAARDEILIIVVGRPERCGYLGSGCEPTSLVSVFADTARVQRLHRRLRRRRAFPHASWPILNVVAVRAAADFWPKVVSH
jgi:hypothetical protein